MHIPLRIPVLSILILASGVAAQGMTCGATTVAQNGRVQFLATSGAVTATVATSGFATLRHLQVGPRAIVVDRNGTRVFDKAGKQIGSNITPTGGMQSVYAAGARFLVADYDRLRIFDIDGKQQGAPIMKTGTNRPWGRAVGSYIAVVDDDRTRFYTAEGKDTGRTHMRGGTYRQTVFAANDIVAVVDDTQCVFCKNDGRKVRTIKNNGKTRQRVTFKDGVVIVIEDDRVTITKAGGLPPDTVVSKTPGTKRQQVVVCGDAIIVIGDDTVRIFGRDGKARGAPIKNNGKNRQTVKTTQDRVIVTDDTGTQIFDKKTGGNIGPRILKSGTDRQTVVAGDDRIVITDEKEVKVYDKNGNPIGLPIKRSGTDTQRVLLGGGRIIVIDSTSVRIFDSKRNQVGDTIPIKNLAPSGVQIDGKVLGITDENRVRFFDLDTGKQRGITRRVGSGVQHLQFATNRIILADGNKVMLFDHGGNQVGPTLTTIGDPEIQVLCWLAGGFASIGTGCSGSNGRIQQSAFGKPALGGTVTYQVIKAPKNSLATMNVGFSKTQFAGLTLPLNLGLIGAAGCFAYNDIQMQLRVQTSSEGFAQVQVPVPPKTELIGLRGYTQFLAPDAAANALGLVTSNGMETLIGTAW